jgi:two-component system, NtrC family, sensor kinase
LGDKRRFTQATLLHVTATTTAIGLGAAILSVLLGASIIVRPMMELVAQARRVGSGDLSVRLVRPHQDEIGLLAAEMNLMCDHLHEARSRLSDETRARIAALEQLRHADRLATVGTLVSGMAHELGTPLNVVSGRAKMIETGSVGGEEATDCARIIREQAERTTRIIRQLLDFSRRENQETGAGELREIAAQTLQLLRPLADKRSVELRMEEAAGGPVRAKVDSGRIRQVLTNLVLNGIQAMPKGGTLTARAQTRMVLPPADHGGEAAEYACVEIEDEGQGMAPDLIPRIFDPFFTTKDVGEGTGLGLSVSYGIVREHGGWIAVRSEPGRGSCFSVFLPPLEGECPQQS